MYCFYAFNDINSDNYAVFAFFYKLYNNNKNINEKWEEAAKNHNHNQTNNGALEADSESYQFLFSFFISYTFFFCFNTREADDDDEVWLWANICSNHTEHSFIDEDIGIA